MHDGHAASPPPSPDERWALLNAQTARIHWQELEPHYRRGAVIQVGRDLDLVAVAVAVVGDDRGAVDSWVKGGQLQQPGADTVSRWRAHEALLWAVVTPPWVLVQEAGP